MNIGDAIEKLYQSIMKRVYRWLLPMLILLSYLTAYSLKEVTFYQYVKRIELVTLHYLSGIALAIILLIIIYNFVYHFLMKDDFKGERLIAISTFYNIRQSTPLFIVELTFYLTLTLVCLNGLLLLFIKYTSFQEYFSLSHNLIILHQFLGWFFLSIVLLKYYLVLVKWYENIIKYLREI
ncbi:MAG: hypothetical protein GY786_09335 [Proteobacteria bacterium]|nr:hypothetical protein [Pseudomonadota bacterium]